MLIIIGWILLGLVAMVIGAFGMKIALDIDNFVISVILMILSVLVLCSGFIIPFTPMIEKSSNDETLNMKACKNIGGKYEVIDQTWNGKFYTHVYGCIKEK